jgi:hypothetical protein
MKRLTSIGLALLLATGSVVATVTPAMAQSVAHHQVANIETAPYIPGAQAQVNGPPIQMSLGNSYPPAWTLRLYNSPDFPVPPSRYDIYLPQFIHGETTSCLRIGGGWDNATLSAFMNAPGQVIAYAGDGCRSEEGVVTIINCIQSYNCFQAKTCAYPTYGFRFAPWFTGGGLLCEPYTSGQISSLAWSRWGRSP